MQARDHPVPSLTATANVRVVVADVNDVVPQFARRSYIFTMPENEPSGFVVGRVLAVDPEHGQSGVVHYSLVASQEAENFDVDRQSGIITSRRPLDREQLPVHRFIVAASNDDVSRPTLSATARVTVYVADVNDNAPEIEFPAPGNELPVYVSSGLERGRRVTQIIARDADNTGSNARHTFHLRGTV